jgi:hypothetical protein
MKAAGFPQSCGFFGSDRDARARGRFQRVVNIADHRMNRRGDSFGATKVNRLYLLFGSVSFGASEATIFSKHGSPRKGS